MTEQSVLLDIDQGIAKVTLNRPKSLNSFNVEMHEQMRAALKTIRNDHTVRVMLLTGNGRGFCAGQDLSDRNV
ncbi:MAG: enoyl-CoA hydratase-related protein, partial [Marinobacter sp.]